MKAVRHLLAKRHIAVLICAAAVLLTLVVPTGYMIASDRGMITLSICSGLTPGTMAMPGMADDMASSPGHEPSNEHGKVEMPCPYAGLSAQMLGAVDPVMLGVALAVVAALALLTVPGPAPQPAAHLRPPLRGPPPAELTIASRPI